jgi:hypothetical protein
MNNTLETGLPIKGGKKLTFNLLNVKGCWEVLAKCPKAGGKYDSGEV